MRDDLNAIALWSIVGLFIYSLVTMQWIFALQYFGLFSVLTAWLLFEDNVLDKHHKQMVLAKKAVKH
jgi:hypothetical protein